jgi:uncharacterized protein (DUF58 family)
VRKTTEEVLEDIGDRVFAMPIGVVWKSKAITPGAGERRSLSRGSQGYEIASRQPYEPGDNPRDIDHYATAQSGDDSIVTITYNEPRDILIATVVDVGRRMLFGTRRTDKRTVSAELVASILACANKTLDRVKVTTVSETEVHFDIGPRSAKSAFAPALEAILEPSFELSEHESSPFSKFAWALSNVLRSAQPELSPNHSAEMQSGKIAALKALPRSKSLVFVISDFIDLSNPEKETIKDLAAIHDLVCIVVQDIRERELPAGRGLYTLQDIVSGRSRTIWLNDESRRQYRENARKRFEELTTFFVEANCDWGVFSTEQESDEVIPEMMRLFGGHRR